MAGHRRYIRRGRRVRDAAGERQMDASAKSDILRIWGRIFWVLQYCITVAKHEQEAVGKSIDR